MKYACFIIWMGFTLIFTLSVIGCVLFIPPYGAERSTWMQLGMDLKNNL